MVSKLKMNYIISMSREVKMSEEKMGGHLFFTELIVVPEGVLEDEVV
jgi:hypothetical protein